MIQDRAYVPRARILRHSRSDEAASVSAFNYPLNADLGRTQQRHGISYILAAAAARSTYRDSTWMALAN